MYESFYRLRERPFSVQPDPAYAYPGAEHQIAIAKIGYAADYRSGLAVLTGPVGVGKTTVANILQNTWAADSKKTVAFLPSASVRTPAAFLRLVLEAYGQDSARYGADNWRFLQKFLLSEDEAGRHCVLLLDEGQAVSPENLDTIAELTNFQTAKTKLITVVILAQDNFANKTERKDAFRSRIAVIGHLDPLTFEDTQAMIAHRLQTAGGGSIGEYFTPEALHSIYKVTRGVPRDICVLCDAALVDGYVRDQALMDEGLIERVATEMSREKRWSLDGAKPPRAAPRPPKPKPEATPAPPAKTPAATGRKAKATK